MMDDDEEGRGPSGYAWFQLGRMAADHERHTSETVAALLHRRRTVNVQDSLQVQNQALAAENARLRQDLAAYQHNYDRLRTWAEEARRDLKRLRGEPD
jgi:hypothetical protein